MDDKRADTPEISSSLVAWMNRRTIEWQARALAAEALLRDQGVDVHQLVHDLLEHAQVEHLHSLEYPQGLSPDLAADAVWLLEHRSSGAHWTPGEAQRATEIEAQLRAAAGREVAP